jgi:outer membrane protein
MRCHVERDAAVVGAVCFVGLICVGLMALGSPAQAGAAQAVMAEPEGEAGAEAPQPTGDDVAVMEDVTPTADLLGRLGAELAIDPDRIRWHLPDVEVAYHLAERALAEARQTGDGAEETFQERLMLRIDSVRREQQIRLSLEEVIRRALANNYALETQRYSPAVEATRVVEAEAVFDAVFFANVQKNIVDQPTASQLQANTLDTLSLTAGIRKAFPTGSQISLSQSLGRQSTSLEFQEINPVWSANTVLEFRQSFLRGFGIDVNRTQIIINRNNQRISEWAFHRQIRDLVRNVEDAYWQLVQARREVVITGRVLVDFEGIYESLEARADFDITPVQLAATRARLERSKAAFVRVQANVRNAEDQLISLMNDPDLDLQSEIEIIPTDFPVPQALVLDRVGEVQAAIEHRPEIHEQELRVDSARVLVGQAKNAELPRLDALFQYTMDGLGTNSDKAYDQMSTSDFVEYLIGVEFEVPIGNRSARAAHTRARLQYTQAVAALRQQLEQVILEVNLALRQVVTAYDQIEPQFKSTEASEEEVRSIVARAERKDINTLTTELNSRESLASARRSLLQILVDATTAVVDLERSKGTLLDYYNIQIVEEIEVDPGS